MNATSRRYAEGRRLFGQLDASEATSAIYGTIRRYLHQLAETTDTGSLAREIIDREITRLGELIDEYDADADDLRGKLLTLAYSPDDAEALTR